MVTITHQQNKRNPHKYVEVHAYSCHHYSFRQYMLWDNGVKNFTGSRNGRLFKVRKNTLESILEDYYPIAIEMKGRC